MKLAMVTQMPQRRKQRASVCMGESSRARQTSKGTHSAVPSEGPRATVKAGRGSEDCVQWVGKHWAGRGGTCKATRQMVGPGNFSLLTPTRLHRVCPSSECQRERTNCKSGVFLYTWCQATHQAAPIGQISRAPLNAPNVGTAMLRS